MRHVRIHGHDSRTVLVEDFRDLECKRYRTEVSCWTVIATNLGCLKSAYNVHVSNTTSEVTSAIQDHVADRGACIRYLDQSVRSQSNLLRLRDKQLPECIFANR